MPNIRRHVTLEEAPMQIALTALSWRHYVSIDTRSFVESLLCFRVALTFCVIT